MTESADHPQPDPQKATPRPNPPGDNLASPAPAAPPADTQQVAADVRQPPSAPTQGSSAPVQPAPTPQPTLPVTATSPAQNPHPTGKNKRSWGFGSGFGLGSGFVLGGGLAIALLHIPFVCLLVLMGLLSGTSGSSMATYPNTLYGESSAQKTVVALDVSGMILAHDDGADIFSTGTYGYRLADQISELDENNSAGLLLVMNTPGGTINGSKAISDAVSDYRERTGNAVFAYVEGLSASGGMMAMASADEIIVDHGSFVGSIGVIMGPFAQYTDVTGTDGGLLGGGVDAGSVTQRNIVAGKGKDFGDPYRPNNPEDYAHYQRQIDIEYGHFVDHVATHRDLEPSYIRDTLGAYVYTTDEAIRVGLADTKMSRPEAFAHIAKTVGGDGEPARIASGTEPDFWAQLLSATALPVTAQTPSAWTTGTEPTAANPVSRADMCTNPTLPLAVHGDLTRACGTGGS